MAQKDYKKPQRSKNNPKASNNNSKDNSRRNNSKPMTWADRVQKITNASRQIMADTPRDQQLEKIKHNHDEWYSKYPAVLNRVGNTQFMQELGAIPYNLENDVDGVKLSFLHGSNRLPGIMAIEYAPVAGFNEGPSDPTNMAFVNLWTSLRAGLSNNATYQPVDLAMYVFALTSCFTMVAVAQRALAAYNTSTLYNRYLRTADLVRALGIKAEHNLNRATIAARLNQQIINLRSYLLPSSVTYVSRQFYLASTVFSDMPETASLAQTFVFVPTTYYTVEYGETGMYCQAHFINTIPGEASQVTLSEILDIIDAQIEKMRYLEDFNRLSAEFKRVDFPAFGLADTNETDSLKPKFDESILLQIHNAEITGATTIGDIQPIVPAGNEFAEPYLVQNIYKKASQMPGNDDNAKRAYSDMLRALPHLIDIHSDAPAALDTIKATRFKHSWVKQAITDPNDLRAVGYGSELLICARIFTFKGMTNNPKIYVLAAEFKMESVLVAEVNWTSYAEYSTASLASVAAWSTFDHAPVIPIVEAFNTGGDTDVRVHGFVGSQYNVGAVTNSQLDSMHAAVMQSLISF